MDVIWYNLILHKSMKEYPFSIQQRRYIYMCSLTVMEPETDTRSPLLPTPLSQLHVYAFGARAGWETMLQHTIILLQVLGWVLLHVQDIINVLCVHMDICSLPLLPQTMASINLLSHTDII